MITNKLILKYCPNFDRIINLDYYEDDAVTERLIHIYEKFIFSSNIENEEDIKLFLSGLSENDKASLDLSGLEDFIDDDLGFGDVVLGLGADIFTFGLSLIEGPAKLVEGIADGTQIFLSGICTPFTLGADYLFGTELTLKMWEDTKAVVSDKKVQSTFDSFYEDTTFGRAIKAKAFGFDMVRGIGSGIGYTAGLIGLTTLTCGLLSGPAITSSGACGIGNIMTNGIANMGLGKLALAGGLSGFSTGTEEAWSDNAGILEGLVYGATSGAWDAAQWAAGGKINKMFLGANNIFAAAGGRVGLDMLDSAAEGFVLPGLKMIYRDYGQGNFADNYRASFEQSGGMSNVFMHGAIGATGSLIGEVTNVRKLFNSGVEPDSDLDIDQKEFADSLFKQAKDDLNKKMDEIKAQNVVYDAKVNGSLSDGGEQPVIISSEKVEVSENNNMLEKGEVSQKRSTQELSKGSTTMTSDVSSSSNARVDKSSMVESSGSTGKVASSSNVMVNKPSTIESSASTGKVMVESIPKQNQSNIEAKSGADVSSGKQVKNSSQQNIQNVPSMSNERTSLLKEENEKLSGMLSDHQKKMSDILEKKGSKNLADRMKSLEKDYSRDLEILKKDKSKGDSTDAFDYLMADVFGRMLR